MRTLLIATMKNEGPFLIEWVAWHRLIGFDDIIVAQNDSDDLTSEMLLCLQSIGAIHFIENSNAGGALVPTNHQGRAYFRATAHPLYAASDWAMTLDADEFVAITTGNGQVKDLIDRLGADVNQIYIHWANMGSGGLSTFEDALVTTRFTQTDVQGKIKIFPNLFKTLYRTAAFERACVHRPKPAILDPERAVTASGTRIASEDMGMSGSKDPGGQEFARVFHYRIRDAESFVLAKTRGRPGTGSITETLGYWARSDARARTDDFMLQQRSRINFEIARLNALSEGRLMDLHRASVALTKERIKAFKMNPNLGPFYKEICRLQSRLRGPEERDAMIELYEKGEINWRPK